MQVIVFIIISQVKLTQLNKNYTLPSTWQSTEYKNQDDVINPNDVITVSPISTIRIRMCVIIPTKAYSKLTILRSYFVTITVQTLVDILTKLTSYAIELNNIFSYIPVH